MKVPEVLISGNHKEIEIWRKKQMLERTKKKRKDLIKNQSSQIDENRYFEKNWFWDL